MPAAAERTPLPLRLAIIAAVTLAGAAWLWWLGPRPVIRGTTPLPLIVPFPYMLSAFPVLGMLVADLVELRRDGARWQAHAELLAQIALLVALSSGRLALRIPLSGHALLMAYVIGRRALVAYPERGVRIVEGLLTGGLLLAIAYTKLQWWDDPVTLRVGMLSGTLLAGVSGWVWRRGGRG